MDGYYTGVWNPKVPKEEWKDHIYSHSYKKQNNTHQNIRKKIAAQGSHRIQLLEIYCSRLPYFTWMDKSLFAWACIKNKRNRNEINGKIRVRNDQVIALTTYEIAKKSLNQVVYELENWFMGIVRCIKKKVWKNCLPIALCTDVLVMMSSITKKKPLKPNSHRIFFTGHFLTAIEIIYD